MRAEPVSERPKGVTCGRQEGQLAHKSLYSRVLRPHPQETVCSPVCFLFCFPCGCLLKTRRVCKLSQSQGGHLLSLSVLKAASSCLRYLMAVQNHLLSNTVLIKPDENEDSDSSLQGETLKVQVNTELYFKDAFSTADKLLHNVVVTVLVNVCEKYEAAHCSVVA